MYHEAKRYWAFLAILTTLFILRVLAQLAQAFGNFSFLPPFEAWQSGVLPYTVLLLLQIVIIVLLIKVVLKFKRGEVSPGLRARNAYLGFGVLYMVTMVIRGLAGVSFAVGHPWLDAPLPTVFHLVLSIFIISVGHYHLKYSNVPEHDV